MIDWTQPLELNDGTPLEVWDHGPRSFIELRLPAKRHPAQPSGGLYISVRRDTGLVISNHAYSVRNRIMIDTTKPLEVVGNTHGTHAVPFITETSEGHILVGKGPVQGRSGSALNWMIFTRQGHFVRSSTGQGSGLILRNVPEAVTRYHGTDTTEGYVHTARASLEEARRQGSGPVIKTTIEDGVVVAVELVK